MNSIEEEIIGYIGCFLLIFSITPQIYKCIKTRCAEDISSLYIIFQIVTCIFCLLYGIILEAYPLIISNIVVFFELLFLLYASIYFTKKNKLKIKISYV
jgi:MtN3 and saliva related transmembrane protein